MKIIEEKINKLLFKYDKYLKLKGRISGEKVLTRQSPFNKLRYHDILFIRNKFIGHWLIKKVMLMDSQKHNFIKLTLDHNQKIRNKNKKYDKDIHREVASFIKENQKIVI